MGQEEEHTGGPRVAVGALVVHEGRVLLVLRGHPPSQGYWAIPGGRVHRGETLQQAAEREILEETGIIIRAGRPIYTFDMIEPDGAGEIRFHYVIVDLAAEYVSGKPIAGDDVRDARWVAPEDLPGLPVNASTLEFLRIFLEGFR
jgi:ADP-ribose pyrophosphatase